MPSDKELEDYTRSVEFQSTEMGRSRQSAPNGIYETLQHRPIVLERKVVVVELSDEYTEQASTRLMSVRAVIR